jgi:hypothetical protein
MALTVSRAWLRQPSLALREQVGGVKNNALDVIELLKRAIENHVAVVHVILVRAKKIM